MKMFSLKPLIKPGITTFILMLVIYLGIWTVNILLLPEFNQPDIAWRHNNWPQLIYLLMLMLLITLNSILIRRFVLHFSLIRTKSFLPVLIFLAFSVVWSGMRTDLFPHLFLTVFLVCIELFLGMYRNRSAVEAAFLGSLLISFTSLYHPLYLIVFPILWLGWSILKSLSLRSWLASLTGMAVPWIFYSAWSWHQGVEITFSPEFSQLSSPAISSAGIPRSLIIYSSVLIFLTIACLFGLFSKLLDDSIQTRKNIYILAITLLFIFTFSTLYPPFSRLFFPLMAFLIAVLMAHPLTLRKSIIYPLIFLLFSAVNILYLIAQHLQLYS